MKNSLIMEEEPYQISVSKYTESNNENCSMFNNSKMNFSISEYVKEMLTNMNNLASCHYIF